MNDVSRADIGFDSEQNEVTILTASDAGGAAASAHVPRGSKAAIAEEVLDAVERLRARAQAPPPESRSARLRPTDGR